MRDLEIMNLNLNFKKARSFRNKLRFNYNFNNNLHNPSQKKSEIHFPNQRIHNLNYAYNESRTFPNPQAPNHHG